MAVPTTRPPYPGAVKQPDGSWLVCADAKGNPTACKPGQHPTGGPGSAIIFPKNYNVSTGNPSLITAPGGILGFNVPGIATPGAPFGTFNPASFLAALTNPGTWWRILEGLLGVIIGYWALKQFASAAQGSQKVVKPSKPKVIPL